MKKYKIEKMIRGWFVGGFKPSVFDTHDCEVGYKEYKKGDYEEFHHHKIATEITLIVKGTVLMNGKEYTKGDIIVIPPKEGTDFWALTDAENVVVKIPGASDDKYLGKYEKA